MNPEEEIIDQLKTAGVTTVSSLPCGKVKNLHQLVTREFHHVPLTREEEGVGISAGTALAGGKPAMLVQSSGIGNMINAVASLTQFYEFPLFIMISWRGVYREGIDAQKPMGAYLPKLLQALGIHYVKIKDVADIGEMAGAASRAYNEDKVTAALLSPRLWTESALETPRWEVRDHIVRGLTLKFKAEHARHTRFDIIEGVKEELKGKAVVCNLGIPSKELYSVLHQPSNFYMLGSMGMATPVGFGLALGTQKEVIVIDGDGSLLMNPGTLATVSELNPPNLTILAVDNGAHGSTGNQPTATRYRAHLGAVARGMGIKNISTALTPDDAAEAMKRGDGPRFIHAVTKPGNRNVKNVPLSPEEIKANVKGFLKG